jgi:hypothetical protein
MWTFMTTVPTSEIIEFFEVFPHDWIQLNGT